MVRRRGLLVAAVMVTTLALTGCTSGSPAPVPSGPANETPVPAVTTAPTVPPAGQEPFAPGVAGCAPGRVGSFTCDSFEVRYPSGSASSFEAWFDVLDGAPRFVIGESERLRILPVRFAGSEAVAAPGPGWRPLQRGCSPDSDCALDLAIERLFTGGAHITMAGRDLRISAGDAALTAKGTGQPHRYPEVGTAATGGKLLLTYRDNGQHLLAADGGRLSLNSAGCLTDGTDVLVLPDTTVLHPDGSIDIAGRHVPIGGRLQLGGGEGPVPADQRCGTGGYFYGWGA